MGDGHRPGEHVLMQNFFVLVIVWFVSNSCIYESQYTFCKTCLVLYPGNRLYLIIYGGVVGGQPALIAFSPPLGWIIGPYVHT